MIIIFIDGLTIINRIVYSNYLGWENKIAKEVKINV